MIKKFIIAKKTEAEAKSFACLDKICLSLLTLSTVFSIAVFIISVIKTNIQENIIMDFFTVSIST